MKVKKFKTHSLEKCYAIAPLRYNKKDYILVAAEKVNRCLMFDLEGNLEDTIWEEPGGTMSIVQVPNSNGIFLATHKFYSPNDSKEAKIVIVSADKNGNWSIRTLVELPHVHRFDIISRDGQYYLVAATLCSGRDFKDDWAHKGKVYYAKLPEDLSAYNEDNQLELTVIKDELLKNHGYFRGYENGYEYCVIGSEDGVYKIVPPKKGEQEFEVIQLLDTPASDMTLVDLDNDGNLEMIVFSPFHGKNLDIYKLKDMRYDKFWSFGETFEFSHALWSGEINGRPMAILGHREGKKQLIAVTMEAGEVVTYVLDENVGVANTLAYKNEDKTYIVSANREIDEIAFYEVR
ncbi:MAG: hypothetical protein BEN19_07335 [Epulopiscium sp. Nuni2H_MBin003]|nr:MAG: hypothetical protein BEN19_07335 [Epulopiscium sp. Nuni2H_MBin003]